MVNPDIDTPLIRQNSGINFNRQNIQKLAMGIIDQT